MENQNSIYDLTKGRAIVGEDPEPSLLRYDYMGPFANAQEAFMVRALRSATMPAALLQDIVRPPLPQVQLFPPRYGYRTRELGIMDVMDVNSEFQPTRVDFTREPGGYQGTSRNVSESVW
jgi:hypothetical protein